MRMNILPVLAILLLTAASCRHPREKVILLHYTQNDIQKQFDTLYNKQDTALPAGPAYKGFSELALATCYDADSNEAGTQDVQSGMYLNFNTGQYDCITGTVFHFADGDITAYGLFNMAPGTETAPDHNFPITGGTSKYRNIYGTYTRVYENGIYKVQLSYKNLP